MYRIVADIHTHTIASGHAYGTVREMAQAASEAGMQILGLTEHAPGVPGTTDPFYYLNLRVIPRELFGVRIIHGSEINILNDGTLSLEQRFMDKLDYAIAGIHTTCYHDEGRIRNTENIASAMKHPLVKLISHPDDDHTPLDYEMLAEAARDTGTALELNNSSLGKPEYRLNCFANYRLMLDCCRRLNVPIIDWKLWVINSIPSDNKQTVSFRFYTEYKESYGYSNKDHCEQDEVDEIRWIPFDEIDNYEWAFNQREVLTNFIALMLSGKLKGSNDIILY